MRGVTVQFYFEEIRNAITELSFKNDYRHGAYKLILYNSVHRRSLTVLSIKTLMNGSI